MHEAAAGRDRLEAFPLGAAITVAELDRDPHPALAQLREHEPVSWLPELQAWFVTRRDLALTVLRDPVSFTVDDPRFSTGQVVGPSMLSTDGDEHTRHRAPFARPFRLDAVRERFETLVADDTEVLLAAIAADGRADLRRALTGPLAVAAMVHALGLHDSDQAEVLRWYEAIVATVTDITAGRDPGDAGARAFSDLALEVRRAVERDPATSLVAAAAAGGAGSLGTDEVVANAAVLLFGGIETTDGMIANAILHLLGDEEQRRLVEVDPALLGAAVEESLRLEPAAAVVDRYTTRPVTLGGVELPAGELVTVSIAAANRDASLFPEPDRFDLRRANAQQHLAFAQGPHVCLGMHLARLEARIALGAVLRRLPGLRLDPTRPSAVRGLVFRKPVELHVVWNGR